MRDGRPGGAVRVAFAGVAHSHAFGDARNLKARGAEIVGVWDADDPAALAQFSEEFGVPRHPSLSDLLGQDPDLVVVTVRTPRAVDVSAEITAAGVASFFNKTIAATESALDDWLAIEDPRRFTSSVLRFAPELERFAAELRSLQIFELEVRAQHNISGLLSGVRQWQDAMDGAGGTLVNFGVHAWEMVDVLLPGEHAEILSGTASRGALATASEAQGAVTARSCDVRLSVTVSGLGETDVYSVRAVTDAGVHTLTLPSGGKGLGYHRAADAMVLLAEGGAPPVSPERTAAVYANVLAAAACARRQV